MLFAPGINMILYSKRDIISASLSFLGFYEWDLSEKIKNISKNSSLMIDVGANMGYFFLVFLGNSDKGRVVAYEPNVDVFSILELNIQNNRLKDRAICHQKAVSDKNGNLLFDCVSTEQSGWGRISINNGICVPAISLDDEFYDSGVIVDILKIDVEGFEYNVLKGAEQMLMAKRIRNIFFETNDEMLEYHNSSKEELEEFFLSKGYNLRSMSKEMVHAYL